MHIRAGDIEMLRHLPMSASLPLLVLASALGSSNLYIMGMGAWQPGHASVVPVMPFKPIYNSSSSSSRQAGLRGDNNSPEHKSHDM